MVSEVGHHVKQPRPEGSDEPIIAPGGLIRLGIIVFTITVCTLVARWAYTLDVWVLLAIVVPVVVVGLISAALSDLRR